MRLKELREERNLTQKEVSDAIGGSQSNLAKWEKEKIQPAADMIVKLADFFKVTTDYLLGRADDFGNTVISVSAPSSLSSEEIELLDLYRTMTREQKTRFLSYGEGMLGIDSSKSKNNIKKIF